MSLPAGEYQVTYDRGVTWGPVHRSVAIYALTCNHLSNLEAARMLLSGAGLFTLSGTGYRLVPVSSNADPRLGAEADVGHVVRGGGL